MCIESGEKLSEKEEKLITHYFESYEYAINVNNALRGEPMTTAMTTVEAGKDGEAIENAILKKGLKFEADTLLFRAMSQEFHGATLAMSRAPNAPSATPTRCLVSAASTTAASNFGGVKFLYFLVIPRGERYMRRKTYSVGVGDWYEYLLPPGHIYFFGNYSQVPDKAIPVVYLRNADQLQDFKRLLMMAGMKDFSIPKPIAVPVPRMSERRTIELAPGIQVPVLLNSTATSRFMLFPWGFEETFGDDTVRIFDIRRNAKW